MLRIPPRLLYHELGANFQNIVEDRFYLLRLSMQKFSTKICEKHVTKNTHRRSHPLKTVTHISLSLFRQLYLSWWYNICSWFFTNVWGMAFIFNKKIAIYFFSINSIFFCEINLNCSFSRYLSQNSNKKNYNIFWNSLTLVWQHFNFRKSLIKKSKRYFKNSRKISNFSFIKL